MMLTEHFHHSYLIAFVMPAGHREVAPREFDVHSRWKPEREAEERRRRRRKEKEEEEEKEEEGEAEEEPGETKTEP